MKKVMFTLILMVFLLHGVFAATTQITIKSLANSQIQIITLQEGSQPGLIERLDVTTDRYGDATITFSTNEATYRLASSLYINDNLIMEAESIAGLIPGENVYLELIPQGFAVLQNPDKIKINETVNSNDTNETKANETIDSLEIPKMDKKINTDSTMSGLVIFENGKPTATSYVLIFVLLVGAIIFFLVKRSKKDTPKEIKEIKIKKLSEVKKEQEEKEETTNDKLDNAQKKLEDLQKEIEDLQKEKKDHKSQKELELEKAKKEVIEAEKRLMALRNKKD